MDDEIRKQIATKMEYVQFNDNEQVNRAKGENFYVIIKGKKIFKHLLIIMIIA